MKTLSLDLTLATLLTALFGAAVSTYLPQTSFLAGAIQMLLMAGTGWVVLMLGARLRLTNWLDYWKSLGCSMRVGVLILLPFSLLQLILTTLPWGWALASVLLSSGTMLFLHLRARYFDAFPPSWALAWFLSLQITAIAWIDVFYL